MRDLDPTLIIAKNQLYTEQPWVWLFEVTLRNGDPLRLAAYPEELKWGGRTWRAFYAVVDTISTEVGRRGTLQVTVANVNREISAYIEDDDLKGCEATVYLINREYPALVDEVPSFSYSINQVQRDDIVAVMLLGHEDLSRLQVPWRRYIRERCGHRYRGEDCDYPNDRFGPIAEQEFVPGGDGDKGSGWAVLNGAHAVPGGSYVGEGNLHIQCASGGPWLWRDLNEDGPFVYKRLKGALTVQTRYVAAPESLSGGMLLLRDSSGASPWWVAMAAEYIEPLQRLTILKTENGITTRLYTGALDSYWQIERDGPHFVFSAHDEYSTEWRTLLTLSPFDLGHALEVGFATFALSDGEGSRQSWDFFLVPSGGLATCSQTLDGPNGCRVHQNTLSYGGCPSSPRGRLYGF